MLDKGSLKNLCNNILLKFDKSISVDLEEFSTGTKSTISIFC